MEKHINQLENKRKNMFASWKKIMKKLFLIVDNILKLYSYGANIQFYVIFNPVERD